MNIKQTITNFKINNESVPDKEVDFLVERVAIDCMRHIVSNVMKNGDAQGAWKDIKASYQIGRVHESVLLPSAKLVRYAVQQPFSNACIAEDLEGIKEALRNFPSINHDGSLDPDSNILTDLATIGNLKALKFFIEDDFINSHGFYKSQVGFEHNKGKLFEITYNFEQIEVLRYLILEHNLEFTPEAKKVLKEDKTDFKNEVLSIIENKHLNFMLDLTLQSKAEIKQKNKI